MVTNSRSARRRKPAPARKERVVRVPKRRKGEDIHAYIIRLGDSLPEEEAARLPVDGSYQHDHYIYGTPKIP